MARALAAAVLVIVAVSAAHAQTTVTASWERNTDPYTAGYRLYYGTASGSYQWSLDAGNQVSARLTLSSGRYFFAVRAYDSSNRYSPASNEVSFTVGTTTPAPTAAIQARLQAPNLALVTWQTTNAVSVTINGTSVAVSGSASVTIAATTTYAITARNAAGQTATASATVVVSTDGGTTTAPQPVINMRATVSGPSVTLSWQRNPLGGAPTNYILDVGRSSWADDVISMRSLGNVLSVSGTLPAGSYYARVRAANSVDVARSNEEVFFRIGAQLDSPTDLVARWDGTQATLQWGAPAARSADSMPSQYVLEAGTAPGLTDVARLALGPATTFSVNVTSGVYFVRVRAVNGRGDSDPSPEIVVAAPGTAAAPAALTAGGGGSTVDLSWTAPVGGPPIWGYVIEAGSDPFHSDLARIQLGNVTVFTTTAPPGTYFVRYVW